MNDVSPSSQLRVALVGRPNVGKSTLFNRLIGMRHALIHDRPGVTRDWREGEGSIGDLTFRVIDTAGLDLPMSHDSIDGVQMLMNTQTLSVLSGVDIVFFMYDARAGITPLDHDVAQRLRPYGRPVVLLANKCEGRIPEGLRHDAYALGFGDPLPVSGEHGDGMGLLYDVLKGFINKKHPETTDNIDIVTSDAMESASDNEDSDQRSHISKPIHVAIMGRPNVGKSTLLNAFLGESRVLTGPQAGLTRDAIAAEWFYKQRHFKLIDTAGQRRGAKIHDPVERLAIIDGNRVMGMAHVVIVLVDSTMPLEKQDLAIARTVFDEGRAMVIALNKWDMIRDKQRVLKDIEDRLSVTLAQAKGIPLIPISALHQKNIYAVMDGVLSMYHVWNKKISTSLLNRWIQPLLDQHPPPRVQGRRPKIKFMTQIKTRPPTFALHGNQLDDLPDSYHRYLVNDLRQTFDMPGVPIRLLIKSSKNPFAS